MASVNLSPLFNGQTIFGPTGLPLAGGQIFTYQAGSSTPLATYTDVNGTIANANPIILGADGKLPNELWLQSGYSYKYVLQDANSVLINTYDNIAGILTQIPTSAPSIPSGCIIIWSGAVGAIPSGFYLCDGSNGTPDLRNSFVIGAGNSYSVGQTGGSADSIVVSHTHTATSVVNDPGHIHAYVNGTTNPGYKPDGATGPAGYLGGMNNTNSATTGITVSTSNASAGTSGTGANLPPYYALAYIQKA